MGPVGPVPAIINDRVSLHIGRLLIQGETLNYELEVARAKIVELEARIAELEAAAPKKRTPA